jgi:hypothetical protein
MVELNTVLNLNFKSLVQFQVVFGFIDDFRQLPVQLFVDEDVLVVKGGQVEGDVFLEVEAMVEETVSKEALDEPGGPVFFEFIVNAFLLSFVVYVLAPLLLDFDCRSGPFE